MILYAYASCILGWSSMPRLAQALLSARGFDKMGDWTSRILAALVCTLGACLAWAFIPDTVSCLAFSFGCVCMAGLLICDLREHVLPTELVMAFLAFSIIFRLTMGTVYELLAIALPAIAIAAFLFGINALCRHHGSRDLIGAGDIRMIVPLALFCGTAGIMYGIMAGAMTMAALALVQIVLKRATAKTQIALAPGLTVWLFVGALIPFV